MGYCNILLHLDERDDVARLGPLIALARELGTRELTTVAASAVTPPITGLPVGPGALLMRDAGVRETMLRLQEGVVEAADGFRLEWRGDIVADPTAYLLAQVARSDLVMVRRRRDPDRGFSPLDLERLVFGAGRPIFVVPQAWDVKRLQRVLVAYKAGREARLAVIAALPLLQQADQILVVGIGDESTADDLADVVAHLGCQGVYAEARHVAHKGPVTATSLIDAAQASDCGAIVCGAFQHGRASERLFGGVHTRPSQPLSAALSDGPLMAITSSQRSRRCRHAVYRCSGFRFRAPPRSALVRALGFRLTSCPSLTKVRQCH